MAAIGITAFAFGALLGRRFTVWVLLICLGATIPATIAVMLLWSGSVMSAMLAAFLLVTGMEVGFLAGACLAQARMLRPVVRLASLSINRPPISR